MGFSSGRTAERCQRLIQKQAIVHAHSPHDQRVTVSVGVGTVVPDEHIKPSQFLEQVDQRLYLAKKNGKNRVEAGPVTQVLSAPAHPYTRLLVQAAA